MTTSPAISRPSTNSTRRAGPPLAAASTRSIAPFSTTSMPARSSASSSGAWSSGATLCGQNTCSVAIRITRWPLAAMAWATSSPRMSPPSMIAVPPSGSASAVASAAAVGAEAVEQWRVLGQARRQIAAAAARDQQRVVGDLLAMREHEHPAPRVDLDHPALAPHRDPVVLVDIPADRPGIAPVALALEHLRQLVAVVEQQAADRDDGDAVVGIALAQHGGGAVAGDAVADDHVVVVCRHLGNGPTRLIARADAPAARLALAMTRTTPTPALPDEGGGGQARRGQVALPPCGGESGVGGAPLLALQRLTHIPTHGRNRVMALGSHVLIEDLVLGDRDAVRRADHVAGAAADALVVVDPDRADLVPLVASPAARRSCRRP